MKVLVIVLATMAALASARPAAAVPITVGDPLWYEFQFGGTGTFAFACATCTPSSAGDSQLAGDPPWTFSAPAEGATFTITDAFARGDEFEVFDFGISLGSTPVVADSGSCGSAPVPCLADALVSHALYGLAPGPHSITIKMTDSPFGSGAAYFRVDASTVPEPMSLLLLGSGAAGLLAGRRRQASRRS